MKENLKRKQKPIQEKEADNYKQKIGGTYGKD